MAAPALSAPLTCLTAGGLGVTYALLQLRVGLHRVNTGISLGNHGADGKEDESLVAKSRAGGNMQEYVPTGLLLMLLMETASPLPRRLVAAFGGAFALARLSVAYALTNANNPKVDHIPPRKYGFLATIGLLVAGGAYLAAEAVKSLRK
ncbi:hypothetical protein GPECTOR_1413g619 [Gonium pectorale]|uniref:Uncharacterized protein n=1 Tax=Gonium pectorale TaxID=33097 RepID=A0A150FTG7_GONPE|nr:hypothetical protein GPECTOR_1413g619 [Gonium pectorale]|eukprot:KXZ40904.1 hypothetical protein GPECTOR_1413g619 [Gonium pectorale]